jgi:hypothetical protein
VAKNRVIVWPPNLELTPSIKRIEKATTFNRQFHLRFRPSRALPGSVPQSSSFCVREYLFPS